LNYQKDHDLNYLSKRMDKKFKKLEENYKDRLEDIKKKHSAEMEHLEERKRT
jgi:hypothetical protein